MKCPKLNPSILASSYPKCEFLSRWKIVKTLMVAMEKVIGSGEPSGFIMTSDTGDATLMEELLISFKSI